MKQDCTGLYILANCIIKFVGRVGTLSVWHTERIYCCLCAGAPLTQPIKTTLPSKFDPRCMPTYCA